MSIHCSTQAIVLGYQEKGEGDRVVTIFTQNFGRLDVLVKGMRKMKSKLRGGLPLFSISEIRFVEGKSWKRLTDSVLVQEFDSLKKELDKITLASKAADVFKSLVKGEQKEDRIWSLLLDFFSCLDSNSRIDLLYPYFCWNLVALLGYEPELYQCLVCRNSLNPGGLNFSNKGGLVCSKCVSDKQDLMVVQANTVKVIREALKRNPQDFLKIKVRPEVKKEVEQVTEFYLSSLLS